jgi:hypothetical protein
VVLPFQRQHVRCMCTYSYNILTIHPARFDAGADSAPRPAAGGENTFKISSVEAVQLSDFQRAAGNSPASGDAPDSRSPDSNYTSSAPFSRPSGNPAEHTYSQVEYAPDGNQKASSRPSTPTTTHLQLSYPSSHTRTRSPKYLR